MEYEMKKLDAYESDNLYDADIYHSTIEVTARDYYYCCETRLHLRCRLLCLDYIIKQIFNAFQINKVHYHNSKIYFLEAGGLYVELEDIDESSTFQSQHTSKKCPKSLRWNDVIALRYTYDNIGLKMNLFGISAEFKFNQSIINKVKQLSNVYVGWRAIRGDGNCYYRAVIFNLMETLIETRNSNGFQILATLCTQLLTELHEDAQGKDPLRVTSPGKFSKEKKMGVDDCSDINRINSVLVHLNKFINGKGWSFIRKFESDWLNPAILLDHNFILFARLLVSRYIIKNQNSEIFGLSIKDAILPSYPDCSNITEYCMKHIETMGSDAEGVVVSGGLLLTALHCSGCTVFLDRREDVKLSVTNYNYPIPEKLGSPSAAATEANDTDATNIVKTHHDNSNNNNNNNNVILADIHVLLRPGHYDLLYLHEGVSSLSPLERLTKIDQMVESICTTTPPAVNITTAKKDIENKSAAAVAPIINNNKNNNDIVEKEVFPTKEEGCESHQLTHAASSQMTSNTPTHTTSAVPTHITSTTVSHPTSNTSTYSPPGKGLLYSELLQTPKRFVIQYFDMKYTLFIHGNRRSEDDDIVLLRQYKAYIPLYSDDIQLDRFRAEIRRAFSIENTTDISFVAENKLQWLLFPSDFPALINNNQHHTTTTTMKYDTVNLLFDLKDNSTVTLEMDDVITFWVDIETVTCADHFLITLDCTRAFGSSYKEYETKLFTDLLLEYLIPSFGLKEEYTWKLVLDDSKLTNTTTTTTNNNNNNNKNSSSGNFILYDGCHILIVGTTQPSEATNIQNQLNRTTSVEEDDGMKGGYNKHSKHNVQTIVPTIVPSTKNNKDIVRKYSTHVDHDVNKNHRKGSSSNTGEGGEQNGKYYVPMDVDGHYTNSPPSRGTTSSTTSPSTTSPSTKSVPGLSPPSYRDAVAMNATATAARTRLGSGASSISGHEYGYTGNAAHVPSSLVPASCQASRGAASGKENNIVLCQRTATPPTIVVITIQACGHTVCSLFLEDHLFEFSKALNINSVYYFPAFQILRATFTDDQPIEPSLRFVRCPVAHCPAVLSSADVEQLSHNQFWINTAIEEYTNRSSQQFCCLHTVCRSCSTSPKHIDEMSVLACGHIFHPICLAECIQLQFRRSRMSAGDNVPIVCPACEFFGSHCCCNTCQLRGLQRLYFEHLINLKEINSLVMLVSSAGIFRTNDAETFQQLQSRNMDNLQLQLNNGIVSIVCSCIVLGGTAVAKTRVVTYAHDPRIGRCLRCSQLYCLQCFTKEHIGYNCEQKKLLKETSAWKDKPHWNTNY